MTNFDIENQRILDVVNEEDEVIDAVSRTDIHKLGLLHREVHVWMFDESKNIIFQKRGLHRKSAGLLDATVGGHLNKGEPYLDAAIRETQEETGMTISSDDLVLLGVLREEDKPNDIFGSINNFIRWVYIFKKPVNFDSLKKEEGVPGGGFQKLSQKFLIISSQQHINEFGPFIFAEEVPEVLKYLKKYA